MLGDSGAALLVDRRAAATPVAGVAVCAGPPDADGPPPEVAEDPAAPAFLAYTSGTTGRPRGAILTSAALRANQEQCLAMEPPPVRSRRPGAAGAAAVPRLRPQRRLRPGRRHRRVRRPARTTFDPRASLRAHGRASRSPPSPGRRRCTRPGSPPPTPRAATPTCAARFAAVRVASSGAAPLPRGGLDGDARARRGHRLGGLRAHRGRARSSPARWPPAGPSPTASAARCPGSRSCCATPRPPERRHRVRRTPTTTPTRGPARSGSAGRTCSPATGPTAPTGPDAEGWLATGDLAYRDADGDLHLVDRRSDLILVSGFNVYPAEVERVLDAHPAVARERGHRRARRADRVRRARGRRPRAEGAAVTSEELREHAAGSLARYKVPTSVHFLDHLPHSLTGKVSRARLRELGLTRAESADDERDRRWLSARLQLLTRAGCHLCADRRRDAGRGSAAEAGLEPADRRRRRRPRAAGRVRRPGAGRPAGRPGAQLLHRRRPPPAARPRAAADPLGAVGSQGGPPPQVHPSGLVSALTGRTRDFVPAFTSGYRGLRTRASDARRRPPIRRTPPGPRRARARACCGEARDPAAAPDHPGGHRRPPGRVPPGAHRPGRRRPDHRLHPASWPRPPGSTPPGCARTSPTSAPAASAASATTSTPCATAIAAVLGGEQSRACVLVGIGNLGSALADYAGFGTRGFEFVGLFDAAPDRVGQRIGGHTVRPVDELEEVVARDRRLDRRHRHPGRGRAGGLRPAGRRRRPQHPELRAGGADRARRRRRPQGRPLRRAADAGLPRRQQRLAADACGELA